MSWKKYFKVVDQNTMGYSQSQGLTPPARRNYNSFLPEVYAGHPNRLDRYYQYDQMDTDPEINAALDIISEFCTETTTENGTTFQFEFNTQATDTEIKVLKESLISWYRQNDFDKRMFRIFRSTLKYGDQVFVRDPESLTLNHVAMTHVSKVFVDESEGKKPETYQCTNLNINLAAKTMTQQQPGSAESYSTTQPVPAGSAAARGGPAPYGMNSSGGTVGGGRFDKQQNQTNVDAKHVCHISLNEGIDANWPFGTSVLEHVFKVYKQKELLEDAIIIYRLQRAPERRIFYIDVGNMPAHMAMQFVERVKNEIHQRRIPSITGGGQNIMDATYNPLSTSEDYFFPQTADGRGSKVDTLPGGQNLSEIDDLKFFTNKLFRGLRIPSSYLPTGADDSERALNDGKVGTSLIQELRFNKYCIRLQSLISPALDQEFKIYLKMRGINIDTSMFDLKFAEPQNFAAYKEIELDTVRINNFNTLQALPYISKRWALKRYLGLSEEEVADNEQAWSIENKDKLPPGADQSGALGASTPNMSAVDITAGGLEGDLGQFGSETPAEAGAGAGTLGAPPAGGAPGLGGLGPI
jgi:hypothetical protein